jgi:hypothetical protein|tara:strand:+ start:25197 stop:25325 length:129 start_codon:yes stop_codon:yes gene_type:complete
MRAAYARMSNLMANNPEIEDLGTAACVLALTRIKGVYEAIGI